MSNKNQGGSILLLAIFGAIALMIFAGDFLFLFYILGFFVVVFIFINLFGRR
ncbi:hypothetical protein SAMN04487979_101384 [Flavobacterium sp. ov086]|nr:hypothetical protein SAMN04487979_101384 [Flavobacterium sp. ov086]